METLSLTQLVARMVRITPTHLNAPTQAVQAPTQTVGTGLNDITSGGTAETDLDHTYVVKIVTADSTDQFAVSEDGGDFGDPTDITGSEQSIGSYSATITFAATTGHTLNDEFTFKAAAGVAVSAKSLACVVQNDVGADVTLKLYDGTGTDGTLLYSSATANWAAGRNDYLGFLLSSGSLYAVVDVTTTNPDLIVGTD